MNKGLISFFEMMNTYQFGDTMFKYCKTCETLVESNQEYCLKHDPKAKLGASTWKPTKKPLTSQVDGEHYKKMVIQPIEYCQANKFNACQSHAIKYISRYPWKHGAKDICKAIHILDILLQLEYGTTYKELTEEAVKTDA